MEGSLLGRTCGEYAIRGLVLTVGLFFMALGIAFSVKADLGISPISCTPYVFSLWGPLTIGTYTIIYHVGIILIQFLLLRSQFRLSMLTQLPAGMVFGLFIDLAMWMCSSLAPNVYWVKLVLCLASCGVMGFGVFLQVKANLFFLAAEGLNLAVMKLKPWDFGAIKTGIDCCFVLLGVVCSLCFFGEVIGVREGTVIAAVLVGLFVRFYNRHSVWIDKIIARFSPEPLPVSLQPKSPVYDPNCPLIISIDREYGSGGHEIGKLLAEQLGIRFYDSELIRLAAEQSGLSPKVVQKYGQQLANRFLYLLYAQNFAYLPNEMPPADAVFLSQSYVIRDIAAREPCVIVGRLANFVLKNRPNLFSVFLHADVSARLDRMVTNYHIPADQAGKKLQIMDSRRYNHCKYYTGHDFGDSLLYDITLNTCRYGVEGTCRLIVNAMKERGYLSQ